MRLRFLIGNLGQPMQSMLCGFTKNLTCSRKQNTSTDLGKWPVLEIAGSLNKSHYNSLFSNDQLRREREKRCFEISNKNTRTSAECNYTHLPSSILSVIVLISLYFRLWYCRIGKQGKGVGSPHLCAPLFYQNINILPLWLLVTS